MLDPTFVVTPTIRLLSDELVSAVETPDARLIVTTPPRTGKSTLVSRIFPVWLLMRDPDSELILKSYGDQLAEEHSAILSSTTGFGANYLIVDDPVKGAQEADSDAHRRRLVNEFRASLMTRLMPGGSAIVVLTRWHEQDIAGSLLAEPDSRWRCVNIPAVATSGVPDALHRAPGTALTSANGFTLERFTEIKSEVGSRQWAALYLGTPTSPEGGLIKAEWIDGHRLIAASRGPTMTVVGVDPAESGEGDETGIVAGQIGRDGQITLTHNASAHLTSEGWVNRAVELAVAIGASRIVVEGYSAATTYTRLLREAVETSGARHKITVTTWPPKGQARKGDSLSRAQGLIAAMETGRCRIAGQLPGLEADMLGWEAGQHQPDSVAAATIVFETLAATAGARFTFSAPLRGRLSGSGGLAPVVPINSGRSPWARRIGGL